MRSIASRMSVMSGEGALVRLCPRQRTRKPGPLHHSPRTRRARLSPGASVADAAAQRHRRRKRPLLRRRRHPRPARRNRRLPAAHTRTSDVSPDQYRPRARLQGCSVLCHDGAPRYRRRSPLSRSRLSRISLDHPRPGRRSRALRAFAAQSFSARSGRNRREDHPPHAHADHQLSRQSYRHGLHRCRSAPPRRTRRQARSLGSLRRNLCPHHLRRRSIFPCCAIPAWRSAPSSSTDFPRALP